LGHVPILVSMLTGAQSHGIDLSIPAQGGIDEARPRHAPEPDGIICGMKPKKLPHFAGWAEVVVLNG
jgi:hypothetical protein